MKRILLFMLTFVAAMMSVSCVDEISDPSAYMQELTFSASYESETRTALTEGNGVNWLPGDQIAVSGADEPFTTDIDEPSDFTRFTGSAAQTSEYYAVYPYSSLKSWDGSVATVEIPQIQTAVKGTFADDLNISVASTSADDMSFRFHNVLGYVKFTITEESGSIKSVTVKTIGKEPLAGVIDVDCAKDYPAATLLENSQFSVTLVSETVLELGDYYIALLPGTYSSGLEFTFTNEEGLVATKQIARELTLTAGRIRNIGEVKGLEFGESVEAQLAKEREALIAIYNALDGDNWTNNTNWCSDKPVSEWYGVGCKNEHINKLWLSFNNLSGTIPSDIAELKYLDELIINGNEITLTKEIGLLTSLTKLGISDTNTTVLPFSLLSFQQLEFLQMQGIEFEVFPEEVFQLMSLKELGYLYQPISPLIGNLINLENLTIGHTKETSIPVELMKCTKLKHLCIDGICVPDYTLTGELPSEIGNLKELESLLISNAKFTGGIPESLSQLCKLSRLHLRNCNIGGDFPCDLLFQLPSLKQISLENNGFTGTISEEFASTDLWRDGWRWVCIGNEIELNSSILFGPIPKETVYDNNGEIVNFEDIYKANTYTIIFNWASWCPTSRMLMEQLVDIYEKYHKKGVEIIGIYGDGYEESRALLKSTGVQWRNIEMYGYNDNTYCLESPYVGIIDVVDNNGNVVFNHIENNPHNLEGWLQTKLNDYTNYYISTDYSQDEKTVTLQTASKGNGINLVLLGDAYSDRQIADGTYEADMEFVYNNLFTEEPYKSFKDYFNVYYVNVVSATEGYAYNDTALDGYFGDGTLVGGDDNACFEYAMNAISENDMNEALVIVVMNQEYYAGTCYMYYPESVTGTYGTGAAVAYFPKGSDQTTFAQLLHHEACGHGFAKLADEYAYEDYGVVPSDYVSEIQTQQNEWGWWKNVDFTSDPTATRWSHFINDARYANEGLGAYEGGLSYWSGVWRPTENSIMRYNTGGFNAPSREAIWYRIHKLAYGDSWEYDYEDFVEYDAVNRATSASAQKSRRNYVEKTFEPAPPPVIVGKSWRDALN